MTPSIKYGDRVLKIAKLSLPDIYVGYEQAMYIQQGQKCLNNVSYRQINMQFIKTEHGSSQPTLCLGWRL
ncbi:hypothetical protein LC593_26435 [Nostoc sp. CHAB 5844]|nr:hypothetical protein [Nostoc sp. CHAB 5844]